jgi:hypothetical protein
VVLYGLSRTTKVRVVSGTINYNLLPFLKRKITRTLELINYARVVYKFESSSCNALYITVSEEELKTGKFKVSEKQREMTPVSFRD